VWLCRAKLFRKQGDSPKRALFGGVRENGEKRGGNPQAFVTTRAGDKGGSKESKERFDNAKRVGLKKRETKSGAKFLNTEKK